MILSRVRYSFTHRPIERAFGIRNDLIKKCYSLLSNGKKTDVFSAGAEKEFNALYWDLETKK